MGFLDKAKKLADQAQAKIDDAQKQFNERQQGAAPAGPPAVEYDQYGRPIQTTSHTAAPADPPPATAPAPPPPAPPAPEASAPQAPPAGPQPDVERQGGEPPKLSSGDPLAG